MYEAVRQKPVRLCPRVNLPQACRHETQWRRRRCTPSAKNSLTCYLNHCTTASSTFSSDMSVFFNYTSTTLEDHVVTSRGCVQNVCIPPISAWRLFGPQLGAICERALCSGMVLSLSVPDVHSLVSVHRLEAFHSSLWIYFVVT